MAKGAYDGTLNIVKQAISLGIKKIIVTGTAASLFDVDLKGAFGTRLITERDFGPIELPDIRPNEQDPRLLYRAAKTVADKKLWEIAADYPDVDITLLLPTLVFGPFVPRYPYPSDINHLGTNSFIYALIKGTPGNQNPYPSYPGGYVVDVRDVAKAHVLALAAPPIPGRYKRMIISAGTFTWEDAVEVVRKKHPELVPRLPSASAVPPAQTSAPLDTSFASEVLGLKEYIPWQESIAEAIEVCLEYENKLKA
ncbi:hypothetical protein VNI00_016837 [Paramarasmius palmivorus]|uniref:NAD-dependent epimerase/dehydratase domain-containing protein n=1 Tax=Paramarasmius palmivorus TaxID=297713 RepID=A0AAW0BA04_9AGAR